MCLYVCLCARMSGGWVSVAYIYIYIYIYVCVCVCVCVLHIRACAYQCDAVTNPSNDVTYPSMILPFFYDITNPSTMTALTPLL